ncbi:helix-turn-helix domain-containing protein [Desulfopila sp. IMCC35006]|uniref:helix-turn-helix domain-containing protein n=1 Tax=Desulfopila sp. IMCC35006 TaxID=2569542 RepID=UPI0010AD731F|nr:helix-turn-helix domain-containing protein [Desulfopila sp. IMCC35006]TKB23388.1 helix-turn-helix domain-containing protein [Desulfopila sp. IMCC35006]
MDINTRLIAIEENQKLIIDLLVSRKTNFSSVMTLKEAAQYTGYSVDHFRRLSVEQRLIPYSRPSEQQKGKLLFRKIDLDIFVEKSIKVENAKQPLGRRRKSTVILTR